MQRIDVNEGKTMWVYKNGFQLTDMTVHQAQKAGWLDPLTPAADVSALQAEILSILQGKGKVIQLRKKGQLLGVILLRREQIDPALIIAEHPDAAQSLTAKIAGKKDAVDGKVTILREVRQVVLPEWAERLHMFMFDNEIHTELGNYFDGELRAILWADMCLTEKTVRVGRINLSGWMVGMGMGVVFGMLMQNVAIGLCFGACFAMCGGLIVSGISKDKKDE